MRSADQILSSIINLGFLENYPELLRDARECLAAQKPAPPSDTRIRAVDGTIVITSPDQTVTITPEHQTFYLVFQHDVVIQARNSGLPPSHWTFAPVKGAPRAELKLWRTEIRFAANSFLGHQVCGLNIGLKCLVNPCPVCGGPQKTIPAYGHRPGLDDGNHRDQSEDRDRGKRALNPQQEAFIREADWLGISTPEQLEQTILDELMVRHSRDLKGVNRPADLRQMNRLLGADPSIPLGWLMTARRSGAQEAESALALANYAAHLKRQQIIGVETYKKLCKPWKQISPGRSEWGGT